jgi:hypothetical protein
MSNRSFSIPQSGAHGDGASGWRTVAPSSILSHAPVISAGVPPITTYIALLPGCHGRLAGTSNAITRVPLAVKGSLVKGQGGAERHGVSRKVKENPW